MKLAIVNQRYGLEVNGGSEYYTRLLAEHLVKYHEVEILTTTAKDYQTWHSEYKAGVEYLNGVLVRRFNVKKERTNWGFRLADRLTRNKIVGTTRIVESLFLKEQGPYCPEIIEYIKKYSDRYDVIVYVTYLYYPTLQGIHEAKCKTVMVPTAHDEAYFYMQLVKDAIEQADALVYLTEEEKKFVEHTYLVSDKKNDVIAIGVNAEEELTETVELSDVSEPYIIYAGRIDKAKGCEEMLQYYLSYRKKEGDNALPFVLIGEKYIEIPDDSNIKYLGFVDEQEKNAYIKNAKALILPSKFESLSISVLEAMNYGVPVLVNGKSDVLKGHVIRSRGGLYYESETEFCTALSSIINSRENYAKMGMQYVDNYYRWNIVEEKWNHLLNDITLGGR